ncbi:MAG: hypothetical protein Q8P63_01250 [Candidatus Nealsonbacteria bacterium]|nr:hypothetical protein [Candidatus Nealsonbacteria bacterium]
MNTPQKILIINNVGILIIIFALGYFLWTRTEKVTPVVVPAGSGADVSLNVLSPYLAQKGFTLGKIEISDMPLGNSGEVEISLKKNIDSIEISWPKEYQIYSLVVKDLGETEKLEDNKIIFGFTSDKPPTRLFPKAGSVSIERSKIEPPIVVDPSLFGGLAKLFQKATYIFPETFSEFKKGQKYSIEALFEKEDEDKIYVGFFGF